METFILTLFIFMAFIASGISFGLFLNQLKVVVAV